MMTQTQPASDSLLRRVIANVAQLPDTELLLVNEFIDDLRQHPVRRQPNPAILEIREEVKRRAAELKRLPRADLVQRFTAVTEAIRQEAIANGTALEGELESD